MQFLQVPDPTNPYFNQFFGDTVTGGFLVADVGGTRSSSLMPPVGARGAKPITYKGYVISDVSLGGQFYSGVQVYIFL